MASYSFFHDESMHDRKLTLAKEKPNHFLENSSDTYISIFLGYEHSRLDSFLKLYESLENKYKKLYSISLENELKGTTLYKKKFKYGISSFDERTLNFYTEFFSLFSENHYIVLMPLSKSAFMLKNIFESIKINNPQIIKEIFIYIIIKFLYNYRCYDIYNLLYNKEVSAHEIINMLIGRINEVVNLSKSSKKKKLEIEALEQVKSILENDCEIELDIEIKYEWDYGKLFNCLDRFLDNNKLDKRVVEIYIGNEINTYNEAIKYNRYREVKNVSSKTHVGIRVSDIFSNFFGKLCLSMDKLFSTKEIYNSNDLRNYDFHTKNLLDEKWFSLDKRQYELYNILYNIFNTRGNKVLVIFNDFMDIPLSVMTLFKYFYTYKSYEEYELINLESHKEFFNTFLCRELTLYWKKNNFS